MKQMMLCPVCMDSEREEKGAWVNLEFSHFEFGSINDEGVYHLKCKNGHETYHVDQSHKFQSLFQSGCFALLDGYHREAVTSFAVSLERLYEKIITTLVLKGCEDNQILKKAWSSVKKQSERQLGAFIYLYLREYARMPEILSTDETNFRNDITHLGYIPTYEQAFEFGEKVINIQRRNLIPVLEKDEKFWLQAFGKELEAKNRLVASGYRRTTMFNPYFMFDTFFIEEMKKEINFKHKLEQIRKMKELFTWIPTPTEKTGQ